MRKVETIFEYQPGRGVVYVFDKKTGECLLRLEGVHNVPEGHQIDVHLVEEGCAHHHEHCGNKNGIAPSLPADPGQFCAEKIPVKPFQRPAARVR